MFLYLIKPIKALNGALLFEDKDIMFGLFMLFLLSQHSSGHKYNIE